MAAKSRSGLSSEKCNGERPPSGGLAGRWFPRARPRLGQAFEAIAGDDDAGAAVEAKAGAVIEPGNLFQARVSAAGVAVVSMMVLRWMGVRR
jgi:hypothetical protein